MTNQIQQITPQQLEDGRKGKLPLEKPTLVGGKTPEVVAKPSHEDQRINPMVRVKIGGVSTPASVPSSGNSGNSANSANGANTVNAPNASNSGNSANASNGANSTNAPQLPGVASVATGTSSPPSIAEQIARAGRQVANSNNANGANVANSGNGGSGNSINAPAKAIVTPTELIFDSTKGDIVGRPEIKSSSYQHDSVTVTLLDMEQSLATQILERGTLEVEAGYVNGFKHNVFVGDIRKVTRILPNKVKIFAVDRAHKAKAAGTGTTNPQTPATTASNSSNAVIPPAVATALAAGKTKPDKNTSPVTTVAEATGTNQADQTIAQPQKLGFVQPGNSKGDIVAKEALNKGAVVVVDGNKITEVSPGQAPSSGIIINWAENPGLFILPPEVTKRNNFDLESGFGTLTVKGFNISGKAVVAATVATPGKPSVHPTGVIQAPEWGSVKLEDPIIPGAGRFTWGLATRNGERVPESKEVMQGIVNITGYLIKWEKELGVTFTITSWYRDQAANVAAKGAANSEHLRGHAVDFWFEGMEAFHAKMDADWSGGVAISPGSFVHIDLSPDRRRWNY